MKSYRLKINNRTLAGLAIAIFMIAIGGQTGAATACGAEGTKLIRELTGSWRGLGTVTPIGGAGERILCRVGYQPTHGGNGVVQTLDCAGTDYHIKARSTISCDGDRISGMWSENIAHNTGTVSGRIHGERIDISFTGPNFEGRIRVDDLRSNSHRVTISQFSPAKGRYVPVATLALKR